MKHALITLTAALSSLACSPKYNVIGIDTGSEEEEEEQIDYSNATLRIVSPTSGSFVPYNELSSFEAELLDKDGNPLAFDEITWTSSVDSAWDPTGLSFEDNTLDVGLHDITAQVALPNGDRVAYSVGGVLRTKRVRRNLCRHLLCERRLQRIPDWLRRLCRVGDRSLR